MAQGGNKSRIIIWSIVGVLVVVAVILLATRPKQTGGPEVNVADFTETMNKKLDKLQARIDKAGLTPEQVAPIEAEMNKVREILGQMANTQDQKELRKLADLAHEANIAARKALKAATGSDSDDEGN